MGCRKQVAIKMKLRMISNSRPVDYLCDHAEAWGFDRYMHTQHQSTFGDILNDL